MTDQTDAPDNETEAEAERRSAGLPDPDEVPEEEIEEIEETREERLAPDNRPDGAEVDNTDRTFDAKAGMFTDNPEYSEDEKQYDPDADDAEG